MLFGMRRLFKLKENYWKIHVFSFRKKLNISKVQFYSLRWNTKSLFQYLYFLEKKIIEQSKSVKVFQNIQQLILMSYFPLNKLQNWRGKFFLYIFFDLLFPWPIYYKLELLYRGCFCRMRHLNYFTSENCIHKK